MVCRVWTLAVLLSQLDVSKGTGGQHWRLLSEASPGPWMVLEDRHDDIKDIAQRISARRQCRSRVEIGAAFESTA